MLDAGWCSCWRVVVLQRRARMRKLAAAQESARGRRRRRRRVGSVGDALGRQMCGVPQVATRWVVDGAWDYFLGGLERSPT